MSTREERQQIATTILNQIGGIGRLRAMTGAHNFVALDSGVSFKMKGRNASGCGNVVRITLNHMDLYDVQVGTVRKYEMTWKHEIHGLYFDSLKPFIERATGRYLSL